MGPEIMANANAPFGFVHRGYTEGQAPTFGQQPFPIASNASAIGRGDPVKLNTSTGKIERWTNGTSALALVGVFVGCQYLNTNGSYQFNGWWPGSGAAQDPIGFVIPATAANAEFLVQASTGPITQADIWLN